MPDKPKFKPEEVIDAIEKTHGFVSQAARLLKCHPDTVRSYARRYASVRQSLREEREKMKDAAELALYNQVMAGESWAVQFFLKTQGKDRGYTERHEVTGENGGPVVQQVCIYLPDNGRGDGKPKQA
jgi:hypothetical protein